MIRRTNLFTSFAAAAMWLAVGATNAGATTLAQSNFDAGTEGWTVFADGTNPTHQLTGGNPGGYITITDKRQGGAFNFVAPASFLGNKSAAYGGLLHFALSQQSDPLGTGPQVDTDDVTLLGAGLKLVFDAGANPTFFSAWSSYDVSLLASAGWKIDSLGGAAATESQLQQVLGALTDLRIRGEFQGEINFADIGNLDTVRLESGPSANVPEPSSMTLLGVGAFVTAWIMRRRSSTDNS